MRFVLEPERKTTVAASCDVLVAGGGIAGIAAAMAAARNGAKVILVEREYTLGGMATLGLVTIYLPLCDGEGKQLIYGIGEELLKLSITHGAEAMYPKAWLESGTPEERRQFRYLAQFNPHLFTLEAEKCLLELGVTLLYGTLVCAVSMQDKTISEVIVENKSGRSAIEVGSVVDCTGDADVFHLAGAKTVLHKNGNGLASWYYYFTGGKVQLKMFGLADVVTEKQPETAKESVRDDTQYNNEVVVSLDRNFRFSGVDGTELSRAVTAAHQIMYKDILEAKAADESYVPVTISTIPLVRMSRRIAGEKTPDVTSDRKYVEDSIGMTGDWRKRGPAFELPYGALWGKDVKNLIAAGRNISVTDEMWDITRVIPPCAVTGEAAGTAAAMCADFALLDVKKLQDKLSAQGVKLHL
ncbi:MAG: FAD-dependent oxidoreductase [Clostridiales bacterium]|nr:FAD-dependent oxidoreductase [Clostridiales bacterium]